MHSVQVVETLPSENISCALCTGYAYVELDRPLVSCLIVFLVIVRYYGF